MRGLRLEGEFPFPCERMRKDRRGLRRFSCRPLVRSSITPELSINFSVRMGVVGPGSADALFSCCRFEGDVPDTTVCGAFMLFCCAVQHMH